MIWRIIWLWIAYLIILWLLTDSWILPQLTKDQKYIWFWIFFILTTILLNKMWYFKYKLKNKDWIYKQQIEQISMSKVRLVEYKINENLIWMNLHFNIWWLDIFCYHSWEIKKLWTRDLYFWYDKVPLLIQEWNQEAFIILRPTNWDLVFSINHWTNFNDQVIWRIYQKKIIDFLIVEAYSHILNKWMQLTEEELMIINDFVWRVDQFWNYNDWWKFINSQQRNMNLLQNMKEDTWN